MAPVIPYSLHRATVKCKSGQQYQELLSRPLTFSNKYIIFHHIFRNEWSFLQLCKSVKKITATKNFGDIVDRRAMKEPNIFHRNSTLPNYSQYPSCCCCEMRNEETPAMNRKRLFFQMGLPSTDRN